MTILPSQPNPVEENAKFRIYWDKVVITEKTIVYNNPDIILVDKLTETVYLIDISVQQ